MRIQVNLASRPFVELRPYLLRLRLLMTGLIVTGLALAFVAHLLSAKALKQQEQLDRLRHQTITVQEAKLHTEQRMADPVNAHVLDRAHFLNTLFLRKSFSWTAVMMDLENVLPNGVQVTSIEPQTTSNGNVIIRLHVAGERANAVQFVRNLERSRRFLQPRLAGEASQTKENGNNARIPLGQPPQNPGAPAGVEFEVLADYNPLPANEPYSVGHGKTVSLATPTVRQTSGNGVPGNRPAANRRRGYPDYGVTLKPYAGPHQPAVQGRPR